MRKSLVSGRTAVCQVQLKTVFFREVDTQRHVLKQKGQQLPKLRVAGSRPVSRSKFPKCPRLLRPGVFSFWALTDLATAAYCRLLSPKSVKVRSVSFWGRMWAYWRSVCFPLRDRRGCSTRTTRWSRGLAMSRPGRGPRRCTPPGAREGPRQSVARNRPEGSPCSARRIDALSPDTTSGREGVASE